MRAPLRGVVALLLLAAPAVAQQNTDSQVQVNDSPYGQLPAAQLWVTPTGGSRMRLGDALAASGGCTTNCSFSNPTITGGTISGTPISGSTGAFTTLSASSGYTGTLANATGLPPAGIAAIPANSMVGNPTGSSAIPGTIGVDGTSITIVSGNLTATGTVGQVNLSSATGLLINSVSAINIDSLFNTAVGFGAGVHSTTGLNTFFGFDAGNANVGGGENTYIGYLSGQFMVDGNQNTYLGEHTGGYDVHSSFNTYVGNDSGRNIVVLGGQGANATLGKGTLIYGGSSYNNTAIGTLALRGNASFIKLAGTPTANETISVVFTWSSTQFVNPSSSPHTVTYNVGATPTLATIATGLSAAINADTTLTNFNVGAGLSQVANSTNILFTFAGSSTTGAGLAIAPSTTGTTTFVTGAGFSGNSNIAIGEAAMVGTYATTASSNIAIGVAGASSVLGALTTGGNNFAVGSGAALAVTTGGSNILIGLQSAPLLTTGSDDIAIGTNTLANIVSAGNQIAIGNGAAQNYVGANNGANNNIIAIGPSALAGAAASNYFSSIAIGGSAGKSVTSASNLTLVGTNAGSLITSGGSNSIFGSGVASTTLATGTGNILIGTSTAVDTPAAGTTNFLNIGNAVIATLAAPTATSGFGTSPTTSGTSSERFALNVGATGTPGTTGVITFATAAPVGWSCQGQDATNSGLYFDSAPLSATTVTLRGWGRTTGTATAPATSDVLVLTCQGG